jgi:nickel-type superoxide dismutase maturation protease
MLRKFFFRLSPILKYQIIGKSMRPTLKAGDMVLVNKAAYWLSLPKRNDIIALRDPRDGKTLIKRIIKIEEKGYFVQGDNKNASTDSRIFGMIRRSEIIGKIITL